MKQSALTGKKELVAALDIGSNKVACFVAQIDESRQFEVLGVGYQLSKGIRGGIVTDASEAETSIIAAIHAAEEMAGVSIDSVVVSLNLPETQSRHIRVELSLGSDPVSNRDIADIIKEGYSNAAQGEEVLHAIPFGYTIDAQRGVRDPRGMIGEQLIADLLLVTVPSNLVRNLQHCIARCHLEIEECIAAPYASALACLEDDEKELGITLIDMGGSTTGYAVFSAGRIIHMGNIPIGAQHITHDLALGLNTSLQQAERLKTIHGSAVISPADDEAMIDVPQLGQEEDEEGLQFPRSAIIHIIRPRLEEIFEMIRHRLEAAGLERMSGGRIAITGGGSQLIGLNEMAGKIMGKQSRIAKGREVEELADAVSGPAFSTVLGMIRYSAIRKQNMPWLQAEERFSLTAPFRRAARWLKENF